MKNKVNYKIKWTHALIALTIILTTLPALIIGLNLISKTEQELTHSINIELTNVANNVSKEINFFFVGQLEKQLLLKRSIENENLGVNEKIALIIAAVSGIEELVSIALIFKEENGFSTAIQSQKSFVDSLYASNNKELSKLIENKDEIANSLISDDSQFGNPIYINSLNQWFIYSILHIKFDDAPDAYILSLIDLSSLKYNLAKPAYSGVGSIMIVNMLGETIFKSVDSFINSDIVNEAVKMLSGDARVTKVSNYIKDDEKFVYSVAFTENIRWAVLAVENYDVAYSLVTDMNKTMSLFIVIGIALAMFFGILTTRRIRKPIDHLVEKANELSKGNFDIKVDYKLDDSIGTLGTSMETMGKSLKSSFSKIEKQKLELEENNRTLENRVLERTQKLKETNNDLQKAYSQVLELNNEKNEFLGIAAHDLKNPLVAIKGFGEIIQEDKNLAREDLEEFAGTIVESSERMFNIITSLLDINKIEVGSVNIKYEVVTANKIVTSLINQNIEAAKRKKIEIIFSPLVENSEFNTDKTLVLQVLDNFLSNAIKFSPMGKPIEINIIIEIDSVTFEVKDNGPGLNKNDKLNLFKKFTKLSARPTAGEHSTGLGLSISKKITEILGGDIFVESEAGKGAKFIVKFPK